MSLRRRFSSSVLAGLAASLLLAACGGGAERAGLTPNPGVIALTDGAGANPAIRGDYVLVDQNGEPASPARFAGKISVIYFGFASCPDVCPLALGRLSAALNELEAAALEDIAPIFITVDPKRDTPEALKAYLSFDPRFTGLTGDEKAVEAARQAFKVYAAEETLEGSALGYTVNHTSLFYLIDRSGTPVYALKDNMAPEEIALALREAVVWR